MSTLLLTPEAPPLREEPEGTYRVGQSRVTLDILLEAYQRGAGLPELKEQFTTLSEAEILGTLAYYYRHREVVDEYLERRRHEADEIRRKIEARQGPQPTREEFERRPRERKGA